MSPDEVLIERHAPAIASIVLNRPNKRNALNSALIQRLTGAVESFSSDPLARVLILRGNGPSFCAGLDLDEAADPTQADRSAHLLADLFEAIALSPLITIAAVHGAAMGGGAGLVAASDLAIAADDLRLAYPEVHRGLTAALVTCLLRRQLSDHAVRELILLGQTLDAPAALRRGLIKQVVRGSDLQNAAMALAVESCRGAPGAIARSKRLLDDLSPRPLSQQLEIALGYHLDARNSAEAEEGIAAFHQKRPPRWPPREM